MILEFKEGDEVTHVCHHGGLENGIVKTIRDYSSAWVVYNCAGDWENYRLFTGALTNYSDLVKGWRAPMKDRMNIH